MCNEICYIKKNKNLAGISWNKKFSKICSRTAGGTQKVLKGLTKSAAPTIQSPQSENPTICSQVSISKIVGALQRSYI